MSAPAQFGISCPTVIRFGVGVSETLPTHLPKDAAHVVLLRGKSGLASQPVREMLAAASLGVTELSVEGEPSVDSLNALQDSLDGVPATAFIACGGGAVMDTGKALRFCAAHDLQLSDDFGEVPETLLAQPIPTPLIVLPTTAGTGAEVTSNAVIEVASKVAKISLRGRALTPDLALVDPSLMRTAPKSVLLSSGLDAVTQIIEAYTSAAATPFSDALTKPQISLGLLALQKCLGSLDNDAMADMAWTSLASGLALANGGLGAAHGLASIVGGKVRAPHGALCGRFLVPVLRHNLAHAEVGSKAHHRIAHCCETIESCFVPLSSGDALSGFEAWTAAHGLPRLASFGIQEGDIAMLAEQSVFASSSRKNAVALPPRAYAEILRAAL